MSYAPSRFSGGTDDGIIQAILPQLHSLPAITSLTLDIPDALTAVTARALGSLTMLTTLELHRGDVESVVEVDVEEQCMLEQDCAEEASGDDSFDQEFIFMVVQGRMGELVAEKYMEHRDELRLLAAQEDWSQALSPLKRLTTIDLSKCLNVTDKALCALTGLTALATLKLSDGMVAAAHDHGLPASTVQQSITDKGIKAVAKLTSLTSLELATLE